MAGAKELRKQIGSIKNTQKITSAMQMVAASKMRTTIFLKNVICVAKSIFLITIVPLQG